MNRRCNLLLVEDHEATRRVLRSVFTRLGWSVSTASTVAEGMALLGHDPQPDWLFLDLMLPDGPGEALLRTVRARHLKTRVVVTSATHDPGRLCAVSAMRPVAMFPKPIDLDGLCRACEAY